MLKTFDTICNCKLYIFLTNNDLLCVQETRWKGEKAKRIGGGHKMWYCGSGNKKNSAEFTRLNVICNVLTFKPAIF